MDCETVGDERLGPGGGPYGQHEHVVGYDWNETLAPFWELAPIRPRRGARSDLEDIVIPAIDALPGTRPIAFVARNSHASYPGPFSGAVNRRRATSPKLLTTALCSGHTTPRATAA